MRFNIKDSKKNISTFLKRCGYTFEGTDERTGEMKFSRFLLGNRYPKFHIYCKESNCNLHLDQKQPSYGGSKAHSGEYDGQLVEGEVRRIQNKI